LTLLTLRDFPGCRILHDYERTKRARNVNHPEARWRLGSHHGDKSLSLPIAVLETNFFASDRETLRHRASMQSKRRDAILNWDAIKTLRSVRYRFLQFSGSLTIHSQLASIKLPDVAAAREFITLGLREYVA